ncbi:MAG: DNA-binding protein [Bacteroidales bacterium 36-12]|nr:MAG: DNA-binding protein [Bacteroidales bacterium 36-12]
MKYKLVQRANPQDRSKVKFYAQPVNEGRIARRDIASEIVNLSSLSRGDVSNVLESLIDTLPKYLLMGKSVSLDGFGTLRLSFSSEGVEDTKTFNTNMISGVRVVFTPSTEFKAALERISFEKSE